MQFSIARLLIVTTIVALFLAVIRAIHWVGPLFFAIGLLLLTVSLIAYPLAILSSPQRGTQLDVKSNKALPFIHFLAGAGLMCLCLFAVYVVAFPFRFLYGSH